MSLRPAPGRSTLTVNVEGAFEVVLAEGYERVEDDGLSFSVGERRYSTVPLVLEAPTASFATGSTTVVSRSRSDRQRPGAMAGDRPRSVGARPGRMDSAGPAWPARVPAVHGCRAAADDGRWGGGAAGVGRPSGACARWPTIGSLRSSSMIRRSGRHWRPRSPMGQPHRPVLGQGRG